MSKTDGQAQPLFENRVGVLLMCVVSLRDGIFCIYLAVAAIGSAVAQADPAPSAPKAIESAGQAAPAANEAGPNWAQLSAEQKIALAPLTKSWPSLSSGHKGKWIALVQKYPEMADTDQARLQSRMVDWAALSPKDRELARLNFAEAKKLPTDSRAANWEAYQALPDSKKQALLDAAPKKPVGAAVAAKPVQASKLAEVPVTRKTPEPIRAAVSQRTTVDRYTLLPQSSGAKETAPRPASPSK